MIVYNYQGGVVPDVKVLEIKRAELRERYDDLFRILSPKAAAEARHRKEPKLTGQAAN